MLQSREHSDLHPELKIIAETSQNLINFVEGYRTFTRVRTPDKRVFELRPLAERLVALHCDNVKTQLDIDPNDLMLHADIDQIEQVLANLLRNSTQAVEAVPGAQIQIKATVCANETIRLSVRNNGSAIPPEIADDIFLPFFTTKPEGNSIGLSRARQIMQLHGGAIQLAANRDGEVEFVLLF